MNNRKHSPEEEEQGALLIADAVALMFEDERDKDVEQDLVEKIKRNLYALNHWPFINDFLAFNDQAVGRGDRLARIIGLTVSCLCRKINHLTNIVKAPRIIHCVFKVVEEDKEVLVNIWDNADDASAEAKYLEELSGVDHMVASISMKCNPK